MVAEFEYCPVACHRSYRVIVVRKLLGTDKGQMRLFEEYRYFFYYVVEFIMWRPTSPPSLTRVTSTWNAT